MLLAPPIGLLAAGTSPGAHRLRSVMIPLPLPGIIITSISISFYVTPWSIVILPSVRNDIPVGRVLWLEQKVAPSVVGDSAALGRFSAIRPIIYATSVKIGYPRKVA